MLSEQLLGYDAREMWLNYLEEWSADIRAECLLKQNLIKPLSMNRIIWPSVMETVFPFAEIMAQYRIGWYGLWNALPLMQAHFAAIWTVDVQPYWMIAVTIVVEEQQEEEQEAYSIDRKWLNPNQIDPTWTFLGYDVAGDFDHWSALTNSCYDRDEAQFLQDKWAAKLNSYHLFENMGDAVEFAEWADLRHTVLAPFDVFGLYLITSGVDSTR